jgi:hypothetical protein
MRHLLSVKSIFSLWAAAFPAPTAASSDTRPHAYTDLNTGIAFNGHGSQSDWVFGMMLPEQPTTDFIAQLVSPLDDGAGWGGVSLGSSMTGPLLLVTW